MVWRTALGVAGGVAGLLIAVAGRYGYNVDELYYRLLGERDLAWGYLDQPPLVPLVVRVLADVSGDALWAIRVPAAACAAAVVVLGVMIAAELGGGRRAQALAAVGLGTSLMVLSVGHVMVTTTVDMVAWSAIVLFASRALLRDSRWWLAAGVTCGLALYAKYVVLLLPVTLLLGLVLVGPRAAVRDRWLLAGAGAAVLLGAPNLVYQVAHGLPQLQMARALAATDGQLNRFILLPSQALLMGLVLTPVWVAGLVGLLRRPDWRPVRALGVAYLLAVVLTVAGGGRPDYVGGFLIALLAAGCVRLDGWLGRRRGRQALVATALAAGAATQLMVALPLLPERSVTGLNNVALESVGWPELAAEVGTVYRGLPEADRRQAVVIAGDLGEAGALDRFGGAYGLPPVYSGHNELHRWGPPPESAQVAVVVGREVPGLDAAFAHCDTVGRVDNGIGVQNAEQGAPIAVCRGRVQAWKELWPSFRHLGG